jgi:eukaryotic-like serine/threonine-protein kinase
MATEPVTLAGRYVLETPIASGGMGTVWRARDEVLARAVAVKVLHPHLSADEAFVARFRREALAAARLSHPSIVAIYDTGSQPDSERGVERHFIVMEFCEGGTLADAAAAEGAFDPEKVVAVGGAICGALGYAHGAGIVHRDIKPANVLIAGDGSLKVGDFGIAKAAFATGDLTTTGSIIGTVTYLSPEQARGEEPDARSDLYALGVVLYELLTGRPPFSSDSQLATAMLHLREPPPAPRSIRAGIPKGLEAVILKALEKERDDRFESAEDMGTALSNSLSGGATALLPSAGRARPTRTSTHARPAGRSDTPRPLPSFDARWLGPVLAVVAVAILLALVVPRLLGSNGGTERGGGRGGRGGALLEVAEVEALDPYGDGEEHSDDAGLAADGNRRGTPWTTENYSAPLEVVKDRPGVGLRFDLGEDPPPVARIEVTGSTGTFQVMAGDEAGSDETDFDEVESGDGLSGRETIELDEPVQARYWLIWITSLPGGSGGEASLAEVEFVEG